MKRSRFWLTLAVLVALAWYAGERIEREWSGPDGRDAAAEVSAAVVDNSPLLKAIAERATDRQVRGSGKVARILSDDTRGSRHQRFIIELPAGQTLLVAHNIDLAPRVERLAVGDEVGFYGEYEWNPQGGVIHWTHRDPGGRHPDGWLRHAGRIYE